MYSSLALTDSLEAQERKKNVRTVFTRLKINGKKKLIYWFYTPQIVWNQKHLKAAAAKQERWKTLKFIARTPKKVLRPTNHSSVYWYDQLHPPPYLSNTEGTYTHTHTHSHESTFNISTDFFQPLGCQTSNAAAKIARSSSWRGRNVNKGERQSTRTIINPP